MVEISGWLTNIIVGLGLVHLKRIPEYLISIGDYVSELSNNKIPYVNIFSICVVVYFGVFGLYIGYNYMRLVLSQKYKTADDNLVTKLQTKIQEKEKQNDEIIHAASMLDTLTYDDIDEAYVKEMKMVANIKFKKGLLANPDDPQKNQWGQKSRKNNRELKAEVKEPEKNIFSVNIQVVSLKPEEDPLVEGEIVLFALHQTFGDPPFRYVRIQKGIANLSFVCYGSFTVGAFVDKGDTELELDLATLPGVSDYFKIH